MNNYDLTSNWKEIRKRINTNFRTNLHVSIASVNEQNLPTVTPIGSLFLNNTPSAFYFEVFTHNLPKNSSHQKEVCVLSVNSSLWFWAKSLFKGSFASYPAIKLYGQLGERREATEQEIGRLQRRFKLFRTTKGYDFLWGHTPFVRDIHFSRVELAILGKTTNFSVV